LKKNGNTVVDTSILIPVLNVTALVAIMLSMGPRVKVEEVVASARPARRLVLGLVANYMIVPGIAVIAYGLSPRSARWASLSESPPFHRRLRIKSSRARNLDFTPLSQIGPSRNQPLTEEIEESSGSLRP
jgi:hypothetical protein